MISPTVQTRRSSATRKFTFIESIIHTFLLCVPHFSPFPTSIDDRVASVLNMSRFEYTWKRRGEGEIPRETELTGNCIRVFRLLIYQTVFQLLNRLTSLSSLHIKIAGIFLRFENCSNVPRASLKQREMSLKKIPC